MAKVDVPSPKDPGSVGSTGANNRDEIIDPDFSVSRYCFPPPMYENLEDLKMYQPGGFHPIHIGDIFDQRFEIVHRLGDGGYATVWLCHNIKTQCWRAVKVLAACKSRSLQACTEWTMRDVLGGSSLVALPEDFFWVDGPNGRHLALVLPVLGPSISATRCKDVDSANRICRLMVEALDFLHSKGIAHGDFRPSNILHRLHSLDSLSKEQMCSLLRRPDSDSTTYYVRPKAGYSVRPNAPDYVVAAADLRKLRDFIKEDDIAVIDLGVAFKLSDPPEHTTGIPLSYSAPELSFRGRPSASSEVWSLACSILEIHAGLRFGDDVYQTITSMELFLGPLPEQYRPVWDELYALPVVDESDSDDDSDYEPEDYESEKRYLRCLAREMRKKRLTLEKNSGYAKPLNGRLGKPRYRRAFDGTKMKPFCIPHDEVLQIADLLRRMFRYHPADRLYLNDVLQHPWCSHRTRLEG
ncbi:Uu.00g141540.m01.CDS01 [Anthostomella pinea]|uniref:Uu.00g141540.m01.CDS01 n=1 Tax=Anthostomella pinea TaxID=933095 RepID=A0AAI8VQB0_9PEZI|nr:Uu.00g141540.m01.CDS01 [Anthostomella pinea]